MRILITGATGFVGGHLARSLIARGDAEVVGLSLSAKWSSDHGDLQARVPLHTVDLGNQEAVERVLRAVQPAWIMHLAGYADAGKSHQEPEAAWDGNLNATRRLYDAVRAWGERPRLLFVGTGMIYGDGGDAALLDEGSVLRPDSPYAASKAAADLLSYQYFRTCDLPIVRARPFNHAGPGQSPVYAISSFARQAVLIERGEQEPVIRAGNLNALRDFTDVRDVVDAYRLLMEKGKPGEAYNIASGQTVTIHRVLELIKRLARRPLTYVSDPQLVRKVETRVPQVRADALRQITDWAPRFDLEQTLSDTMDYWRFRLA